MTRYTWEEILKMNLSHINLIWYGSLLNPNANSYDKNISPVTVKWFRRIYNIPVVWKKCTDDWLNHMLSYFKKYWVNTKEDIVKIKKQKSCVLNCIKTKDDHIMNGLLFKIKWKDIKWLSIRETQYNLLKTDFNFIDEKNWKILSKWKDAFILTAKKWYTIDWWIPFEPYHKNTRKWAYLLWDYFWKLFDESIIT